MVNNKLSKHSLEEILEKRKSDINQITMQVKYLADINYINNLIVKECTKFNDFYFEDLPLLIVYTYEALETNTVVKPGYYVVLCINIECDIITIDQMYNICMDIIKNNDCIISASEWSTYLIKYKDQLSYRYKSPVINNKEINKNNPLYKLYEDFIKDTSISVILNNPKFIENSKDSKLKLFMLITFYTAYKENVTKNIFFVVDNKKNYKLAKDVIINIVDTWVVNLDKSDVIIFSGSTKSDTKLFNKLVNHINNDLSNIDNFDAIDKLNCYTERIVEDNQCADNNTLIINHRLNKNIDYNYSYIIDIFNNYDYIMEYRKHVSFINIMDISKKYKLNDNDILDLRNSIENSKKYSNMIFADELLMSKDYNYNSIVEELKRLYTKYGKNKNTNIFIYLK